MSHEGAIEDFWGTPLSSLGTVQSFNFTDPDNKARLQRLLQLGALTRYHIPLVIHLDGLETGNPAVPLPIKALAAYDEADWAGVLDE